MGMYGILLIVGICAAFLFFYRRSQVANVASLVEQYDGTVSLLGDTVRFDYRGAPFELRRVATGRGIAGSGGFYVLVLFLSSGRRLTLVPADGTKYLYALSVPSEHSVLAVSGTKLLAIGPDHRSAASALAPLASSGLFARLFSKPFSNLRVLRETRLAWPSLLDGGWTLHLSAVPVEVFQEPESLRPILDGVLDVVGAVGMSSRACASR